MFLHFFSTVTMLMFVAEQAAQGNGMERMMDRGLLSSGLSHLSRT